MRPDGPKIEAEGRERGGVLGEGAASSPPRGSGSDVNKNKTAAYKTKTKTNTKITRPTRPEVNKRHLADLTFK